jgi:H/ACA ribonucleoprotein complex subunit 1
VVEAGAFVHEVEGEMLCKLTNENIPYFNAGIFLENKTRVGKVEEVLGPINQVGYGLGLVWVGLGGKKEGRKVG